MWKLIHQIGSATPHSEVRILFWMCIAFFGGAFKLTDVMDHLSGSEFPLFECCEYSHP